MTINYVCKKFVNREPVKGRYMSVDKEGDRTTLSHRYNRSNSGLIAEIIGGDDFTLILHPRPSGWGKTSHSNRVWGVLRAIAGDDYSNIRYDCFVRYYICINDRKLNVEYKLVDRPIKFNYKNGKLVVDYDDLESNLEGGKEVAIQPNDNSNIKNELDRLTTILTTV